MHLTLERYSYAETETEGQLLLPDMEISTIERPWKNNLLC